MNKIRILIGIAIFAAVSFGQTAELTGLITDPSGAPVPDAAVSVRNVETGVNTDTVTNTQGYYTVTHLNPGNYELTVQKSGFKALTRPGIKLDVAQVARVDMGLTGGDIKDKVTVVAEAPIISTETAVVGQVISSKKILDLPLNGRDFTQLATLAPGAISRGSNANLQAPAMSVNGLRNSKTVFMIDGGNVTSQYFD